MKVVSTALLLALLLAGCTTQDVAQVRETLAGQAREEIVIGVAWPFATNDGGLSDGVALALEQINNEGGIRGARIRVLKKDDKALVTQGLAVAQEFAALPEVVAVIGHRNSYVTLPASSIYETAGLVMLTPGSTAPGITEQGFEFIFRSVPSDASIAREMALLAQKRGHQRMVIYYVDDSYGRGLANAFEDSAAEAGITIVDRISYYGDKRALTDLVRKWEAFEYDGLFVAETALPGAQFISAIRQAGVTVPIYGGNALDSPLLHSIAGRAAEGTVVGSMFEPHSQRAEVQEFVQAFEHKFNYTPNQWAAQGYDALHLLAAAIHRAGSSRPTEIANTLRSLQEWPGASGMHSFDYKGDQRGSMVVKRIMQDGEFRTLSETESTTNSQVGL